MLAQVEVEAHDEVVEWLSGLSSAEWDRVAAATDRLAQLAQRARMPLSRSLGDGLFELRLSLGPLLGASPTGSRPTAGSCC